MKKELNNFIQNTATSKGHLAIPSDRKKMFVIFRTDVIVEALITVTAIMQDINKKRKKMRKKNLELGSNLTRDYEIYVWIP